MGLLERSHSYKDKLARNFTPHHGLFSYPVLMAADILLYQADRVPVGRDQKQHLEIARDIAGSFNNVYGPIFKLPEALIDEDLAIVPGTDGLKMSKSYGNAIVIFSEKDELKSAVMSIKTDARAVSDPKDPDNCNLFKIYSLFVDGDRGEELRARYLAPGLKYSDVKKELIEIAWDYFAERREKRAEISQRKDFVRDVLREGARKAKKVARVTMDAVREEVGLYY
jgi:tryptophanyl-tRNA synthetase